MKLYNTTKSILISKEVVVATNFLDRLKGLLGKRCLEEDTVLWIKSCPSVHTFFMKFSIDVVFVDKSMAVTSVIKNLKPWRMTKIFQYKNDSCFEFSSHTISDQISKGDVLNVCS